MNTVIAKEVKKASLKELVPKLMTDVISEEITKRAKKIFPIQNCVIRKVKTIKRPRFDMTQLLSMHADNQVVKVKEEVAKEEVVASEQ